MNVLIFWDHAAPAGLELPVSRTIADILGIPVTVHESPIILDGYTGSRKQTDAKAVLESLDIYRHRNHITEPLLLVISDDLFMEGSSFLFGLARPSVGVSVVSTTRLDNKYYSLGHNDDDLIDRTAKEGAHEVGHLLGLDHCDDRECIMFNPLTLDDLDRKKRYFCRNCQARLEQVKTRVLSFSGH